LSEKDEQDKQQTGAGTDTQHDAGEDRMSTADQETNNVLESQYSSNTEDEGEKAEAAADNGTGQAVQTVSDSFGSGSGDEPASGGSKGRGWMIVAVALAALLIVVLIKPPFGGGSNEAVATVNGVKIDKDHLYDKLVEVGAGSQILGGMIDEELLNQELKKANVTVGDADIEAELETFKKSFPSEEEFQMTLMQYGMTQDDLKKQLPRQVQIRKLFGDKAKAEVTEETVKKYFDENAANFGDAKFEDKKAEIQEGLTNQKMGELYDAWLKDAKEKGDITNHLDKAKEDEEKAAKEKTDKENADKDKSSNDKSGNEKKDSDTPATSDTNTEKKE